MQANLYNMCRVALRYLFLFCLLLLPAKQLLAQSGSTVTIEGYVLDRSREPIPLASIQVKGSSNGTTANLKGYYKLRLKPHSDSLTLVFSSIGYHTSRRKLPNLLTNLKINVQLGEDTQTLGDVEITASERVPQGALQRLSTDKLTIGGSASGGIEAIVGTLAGVAQKNELSSQYNVRGGNFDENLVYINGVEIYRPLLARSAEQEGLSAINPDMTASLVFSAGGFTADYGDKSSSVLDIRYKQPDSLEGSALLGLLENRIYLGSKHGKLSQITGIRYKRGNTLLSTLDTDAEYDPHYLDIQTSVAYKPNNRWSMSLLGYANGTNYNFTPHERRTTFGTLANAKQLNVSFDGREQDRFRSYLASATLGYTPNAQSRSSASLGYFTSYEAESYDIAGEYILSDAADAAGLPSGDDSPLGDTSKALGIGRDRSHGRNRLNYQVWTASARTQWQWNSKYRLLTGLDFRSEQLSDKVEEWQLRDSVGYTTPLHPMRLIAHRNLYGATQTSSVRVSAFVEQRTRLDVPTFGNLALSLGVRSSWWSWSNEFIFSPRISAQLIPQSNKALSLRLATGVYHQAPFYRELRRERIDAAGNGYIELNSKIRSQSTALILLGADYNFGLSGRKFKLTAEGYYKYLWHLNPYIQENIRLRYLGNNSGRGYVWGLDAKLYGEFVEGVDSWLSLSLLHAQQRISTQTTPSPLPNAPSVNLSLFFQDYFPGFKPIRLALRGNYSSGLPVAHPQAPFGSKSFTSSAYRRVDIGLTYRLTQRANGTNQTWWQGRYVRAIDLGVDVLNLFDMVNTSSYYWVTDAYNHSYAIPNYLTRRAWNISLKFTL